jgi:hypothetical protein
MALPAHRCVIFLRILEDIHLKFTLIILPFWISSFLLVFPCLVLLFASFALSRHKSHAAQLLLLSDLIGRWKKISDLIGRIARLAEKDFECLRHMTWKHLKPTAH